MKKSLVPSLNHNFLVFLVVVLLCYAYSSFVRYEQYKVWEEKAAQYFADQTPMMTTLDSYFWLRWAKEYNDGGIPQGRDRLRNFPDGKRLQHPVPMISYLIAKVAPSFDNNYYRAGFFLMIGLSGAFIFPLAFYFFLIGYPIAGILGGLFGAVSYEYFIRTGIGRVDTDALMLFFPFLIAVLAFQAAQARKLLNVLIYSCLGGGVTYLLTLWWGKPAYVLPFSAVLFLTLFLHRISQTQISDDQAKLLAFKLNIRDFGAYFSRIRPSPLPSVPYLTMAKFGAWQR